MKAMIRKLPEIMYLVSRTLNGTPMMVPCFSRFQKKLYNNIIYFAFINLDNCRNAIGVQSPRPSVGHIGSTQNSTGRSTGAYAIQEQEKIEIKPIPIGDPKVRSKIRFEVVTARVIETGGKKHVVSYY